MRNKVTSVFHCRHVDTLWFFCWLMSCLFLRPEIAMKRAFHRWLPMVFSCLPGPRPASAHTHCLAPRGVRTTPPSDALVVVFASQLSKSSFFPGPRAMLSSCTIQRIPTRQDMAAPTWYWAPPPRCQDGQTSQCQRSAAVHPGDGSGSRWGKSCQNHRQTDKQTNKYSNQIYISK